MRTEKMLAMVGMIADVTERVRAEEALAAMSRKLLEAQEEERARIARELHDDIGQRVSLIGHRDSANDGNTSRFGRGTPESNGRNGEVGMGNFIRHPGHGARVALFQTGLFGFGCSHAKLLHGTKPETKSGHHFCGRKGIPSVVPRDVSLCLFRVTQEALHNAVKHSGVRHFDVRVEGSPWEIHLTVRDSGVGFDPQLAEGTRGLGLISMRERVRLAEGTISITSKPESGTEVSVRVPLPAEAQTEQANSENPESLLGHMVKILLVDDFENWRRKVRQMLQGRTDLQVIGEASDGLEAVQKAVELKPDLILLDIGLPKLNASKPLAKSASWCLIPKYWS